METPAEFVLKSLSGRNSLFYLNEITRHVDRLKRKLRQSNQTSIDRSDLQFFKELCASTEPKVCGIACEAVVSFIKSGAFPLVDAFSWFISILQSGSERNKNSIIQVVADLLLLNEEMGLKLPPSQHPFILAVKQDEQHWSTIIFNLSYILKYKNGIDFQRLSDTLMPFFKYLLWSPMGATSSLCKRGTWKCLIDTIYSKNTDFIVQTLCWYPSRNSYSILDIDHFLCDYDRFYHIINESALNDIMCVYYAYVSCKLAEHGHNPTSSLQVTKMLLRKYPLTTDIVLALFAQTLTDCPAQFINTLLLTCVELIEQNQNENITIQWLVISAILPWLIHSLPLIDGIHETAEKLLVMVDENKQYREKRNLFPVFSNKHFMQLITSEREMHWAFLIASLVETLNHKQLLKQISDIQIAKEETQKYPLLRLCVNAILLSSDDIHIQMKALDISLATYSDFQFPVILFMLARTRNPKMQLKLLHSLPLTATEKENVSAILRTTDTFFSSGKSMLKNLSIEMYFILWKVEERSYSCLHDRLLEYKTSFSSMDYTWETDVVLASTIRRICELKPEKHGKEWISILNEIIKRGHKKKEGSAASVLALDAILILCRAEVLEIISTYKLLSERLFDDKRVGVVKVVCALSEHMFAVTSKEMCEKHRELFYAAESEMWSIILSSSEKEAILSAMNALSKLNELKAMPMEIVPNDYWSNVKLPRPSEECEKQRVATHKEPFLFDHSGVLMSLLRNKSEEIRDKACEMLISWLQKEVDNFPRRFYGTIGRESTDLNFLKDGSLCKSLIEYLKMLAKKINSCDKNDIEIGIICLKILNGNLPKTLPLLDWSFLWKLFEIKELRLAEQVVLLFAKQSKKSLSAKTCIENYLKHFHISDQKDELGIVINAMTDLCCGVSTIVLKSFLSSIVNHVTTQVLDGDKSLLLLMCINCKKALQNSDIEDNNRSCISECVRIFWENTSNDDEVFIHLNDVATELPITYIIEYLCTSSVGEDLTPDKVRKMLRLGCAMALKNSNDNPFLWLQDCVEITMLFLNEKSFYYQYSIEVIWKHHSHSSRWHWLLKFMSYVHSVLSTLSEAKLNFICDVFIFNIVNLSIYKHFIGNNSFSERYFQFFPQALNDIITEEVSGQVIEWLYYMNKSDKISQNYRLLFYDGILSLKNTKFLSNINNWSKILL